MTLDNIKQNAFFQKQSIANACRDPATYDYIISCLARFFAGDYGEVPQEDAEANNADLSAGEGHILARYKAQGELEDDIYIESMFSESNPGIDYNYTMVMYRGER